MTKKKITARKIRVPVVHRMRCLHDIGRGGFRVPQEKDAQIRS